MLIKNIKYSISSLLFVIILSCDSVESNSTNINDSKWLVPKNEVYDGGPGKDGIPALESPELSSIENISYLEEEDLVIIFEQGSNIRIYPHQILDWHEIINDKIGNTAYSITYCPLTGSAICWDRVIGGNETTFGVSGLLYNSNLIPYDRATGSNWSQMLNKSINGVLISEQIVKYPIIETSWATAKNAYDNAEVVTTNTGYNRNYGRYPYGNYKTRNDQLIFPVNNSDNRLENKVRVIGILGNNGTKAYSISEFEGGKRIITDSLGNEDYLIYGDSEKNIMTAFKITSRNSSLTFKLSSLPLPFIIEDNEGNHYDWFGNSRNIESEDLQKADSFISYWFAWAAFYPETELYNFD